MILAQFLISRERSAVWAAVCLNTPKRSVLFQDLTGAERALPGIEHQARQHPEMGAEV
jgi:hypothetical protein